MFKVLDYKTSVEFLLPRHYSGRKPAISYGFGWYNGDKLVAVCTFGKPASNSLCKGVCGDELSSKVFELNRLCVDGDMGIELSQFLAMCLRELKKHNLIVVSYADTMMNHCGYIYQATNFLYTGATKRRTDKYAGEGVHSRHYDKDAEEVYRQVRSSKHRYVTFTGSKTFVKHCRKLLNYPVSPYPKGDNGRYVLGEVTKAEIYKVN